MLVHAGELNSQEAFSYVSYLVPHMNFLNCGPIVIFYDSSLVKDALTKYNDRNFICIWLELFPKPLIPVKFFYLKIYLPVIQQQIFAEVFKKTEFHRA